MLMRSTNCKDGQGSLRVRRLPVTFTSDIRRVITRFFDPGGEARIRSVVDRVNGLSGGQVDRLLDEVLLKFRARHGNIAALLDENYRTAMAMIGMSDDLSHNRRLLIGSYLTAEYSIESAALFNPSIVPHHNQRNLPAGAVRFIMSLRATGEGHVSSIVFRTGVITSDHQIQIDPCGRLARPIRVVPDKQYDKPLFRRKLEDIGVREEAMALVLDRLADSFTLAQLEHAVVEARDAVSEKLPLEASLQDIRGWPNQTISWSFHGKRRRELKRLEESKTFKYETALQSAQGGVVKVQGKNAVMLASNNYLGMSNHPLVCKAAVEGIKKVRVRTRFGPFPDGDADDPPEAGIT